MIKTECTLNCCLSWIPLFKGTSGVQGLSGISKWITRFVARLVPLQVKDPVSRFGKSLLQMPRSRPHWSRYIKIGIRAGRITPSIVSELSLVAAMLCGSWLRETTLGFTFFFSSLRLLDISYFNSVPNFNLTWLSDVRCTHRPVLHSS